MVPTLQGAAVMFISNGDRGSRLVLLTRPMAVGRDSPMAHRDDRAIPGLHLILSALTPKMPSHAGWRGSLCCPEDSERDGRTTDKNYVAAIGGNMLLPVPALVPALTEPTSSKQVSTWLIYHCEISPLRFE